MPAMPSPRPAALGRAVILLALLLAGCGPSDDKRPVYKVTGRITVDGQPAKDAYLVFYSTDSNDKMAPKPTATADENGNLTVTTYITGDGAPAGEYKVGIEWPKIVNNFGRMQPGGDQLNGKFKEVATSKWTVRIQPGENQLPPFELKTK